MTGEGKEDRHKGARTKGGWLSDYSWSEIRGPCVAWGHGALKNRLTGRQTHER